MSLLVLDASALLAVLHQEKGADVVMPILNGALVSTINLSETLQKASSKGLDVTDIARDLQLTGLEFVPVDVTQATLAAHYWAATSRWGLSLADRLCLALAHTRGATAYTADKEWKFAGAAIGVPIKLIR